MDRMYLFYILDMHNRIPEICLAYNGNYLGPILRHSIVC